MPPIKKVETTDTAPVTPEQGTAEDLTPQLSAAIARVNELEAAAAAAALEADALSKKADVDAAALTAAETRIAELEAASTNAPADTVGAPEETGHYMVVSVGAPYRRIGNSEHIETAQRGQVICLADGEAMRLLHLEAIRAATAEEIAGEPGRAMRQRERDAERAAGPRDNPYGGTVLGTTLEKHAEEQIALAKASGALPADA